MPPTVILVHGLYMHGFCMMPLAWRLQREGYRTLIFSYATLRNPLTAVARTLAATVDTVTTTPLHFVGHSLGGLVIRHLTAACPELPPGRTVTLGTPHTGSCIACELSRGRLGPILGPTMDEGLLGNLPPWPPQRELGSIAGTLNLGLGRLLAALPLPADGTVAVAETRFPGMTDHLCLPVNHTGLLLSADVARQVHAFLAAGRFDHTGR